MKSHLASSVPLQGLSTERMYCTHIPLERFSKKKGYPERMTCEVEAQWRDMAVLEEEVRQMGCEGGTSVDAGVSWMDEGLERVYGRVPISAYVVLKMTPQ